MRVRVIAEDCEQLVRGEDGVLYVEKVRGGRELCVSEIGKPAVSPAELLPEVKVLEAHIKRVRQEIAAMKFLETTPGFKKEQKDERDRVLTDAEKKGLMIADITQVRMIFANIEADEDFTGLNLASIPGNRFADALKLVFAQGDMNRGGLLEILDSAPLSAPQKADILSTLQSIHDGFNHPQLMGGWRSRKEPYTREELTKIAIAASCQLVGRYINEHGQAVSQAVREARPVDGPRLVPLPQQQPVGSSPIIPPAPVKQESFGAAVVLGQEDLPPEYSSFKRALKTIRTKFPEAYKIEVVKKDAGHQGLEFEVLKISFTRLEAAKEFAEKSDLSQNYNSALYPVVSPTVTVTGELVQNLMSSFGMHEHGRGGNNTMWDALKYGATPPNQRPASTADLSIDPAKGRVMEAIKKDYPDLESVTIDSNGKLLIGFETIGSANSLAQNTIGLGAPIHAATLEKTVIIPATEAQTFFEMVLNLPHHGSDRKPMYVKLKEVIEAERAKAAPQASQPSQLPFASVRLQGAPQPSSPAPQPSLQHLHGAGQARK
jgi:hypothetical protein